MQSANSGLKRDRDGSSPVRGKPVGPLVWANIWLEIMDHTKM